MNDLTFRDAIAEALACVFHSTESDAEELFGEGIAFTRADVSAETARAIGYLEGAASALDVTVLELLDSLGLWRAP